MAQKFSGLDSRSIALGGILAAGSLVVLYLACIAPSGRFGLAALAGLFPVAGVLAAGRTVGYLCWFAAGVLGLILLPEKGIPLLYLLFFGLYPVVKSRIESIRRQSVECLLKLICFNMALTVSWFALRAMIMPAPPAWLVNNLALLYLGGNLVFLAYDFGLSKLIAVLQTRLRLGRRFG